MDKLAEFMNCVCNAIPLAKLKAKMEEMDGTGGIVGVPKHSDDTIKEDAKLYNEIISETNRSRLKVSRPQQFQGGFWMTRKLRGDLIIDLPVEDGSSYKVYVEIKVVRECSSGEVTSAAISEIRNAVLQTIEYANGYNAHCALLVIIDAKRMCRMDDEERCMIKKCSMLMKGAMSLHVAQAFLPPEPKDSSPVESHSSNDSSHEAENDKWGWEFLR